MPNATANSATMTAAVSAAQGRWHKGFYLIAVVLVVVTFALQSLLAPTLGNQALYLFLVPPVLVAGALGGVGPRLLATALSLVFRFYATEALANLIHTSSPLFTAELARSVTFPFLA